MRRSHDQVQCARSVGSGSVPMPRETAFRRAHVAVSDPPSSSRTQLGVPCVSGLPFGSRGQGLVDASLTSGRRTWLLAAVLLLGRAAGGGEADGAATPTERAQRGGE